MTAGELRLRGQIDCIADSKWSSLTSTAILAIPEIARALRIVAALDAEPVLDRPIIAAWTQYGIGWSDGHDILRDKLLKAGLPS